MRHLVAAAVIPALLLTACSNSRKPDPHTISATTANGAIAGRTTLGMPIQIAGQSTILVPFAIESEKEWFQTHDPYRVRGIGSMSNSLGLTTALSEGDFAPSYATSRYRMVYYGAECRWHNAIFHDLKSGEEWPLLDKRGVVSAWTAYGPPALSEQDFKPRYLIFLATLEDTNHDGALNDLDARVAILTDADGRHARTISPPNAQVWTIAYDHRNDKIYLYVVADTNHDGKFDYDDVPAPYVVDPASGSSTPITSPETLRKVESLLK
jgi:hypothetical protein